MRRLANLPVFYAIALLLSPLLAVGQDAPAAKSIEAEPENKEQIEAALKLTREAAKQYVIEIGRKADRAALLQEPVLRWSNPNVGEVHGNVFLWTVRNRPVAVGSLFKWFSPHKHSSHELHSLAEDRLTAAYQGKPVWTVASPALQFIPIQNAETPAPTAARRLSQMRQLTRRFTGYETTREGEEYEIRLLPQPIYRYESPQDGVLDGGLFAYVLGTDPEILLLMEARGEKEPRWHFAAARMQNCAVWLNLDGQQAWRAEQLEWSVAFDHLQAYTLFDTPGK